MVGADIRARPGRLEIPAQPDFEAWRAWQAHDEDWFGPVPSRLSRIDAPAPHWLAAG
jgi:hypothetical protein